MNPIVSVVIPTANRPHYLPRAIESAMAGMNAGDAEVIVVPNGPDESWRKAMVPYQRNPSVRVIRISEANANIARNAGLADARGEFVRFLDDDDYLIPEGAIKQYELIEAAGVDVVSSSVKLVDAGGRCFDVWHQPDIKDLCAAVTGPWRVCLPLAHVYRRSIIDNAKWNPETSVRQDVEWLFDLCAAMDLRWKKTDDVVGVWQHHWDQRISSSMQFNEIRRITVPMLLRTYECLEAEGRMNSARRRAVALGLWGCVQAAFFLEPAYWRRIAEVARRIDPAARPVQNLYSFPVLCRLNPLFIQWLMLPKRLAFHHGRQLLKKWRFRHNW